MSRIPLLVALILSLIPLSVQAGSQAGDSATIAITLRIPPDPEERQQAIDVCVDNWHEEAFGAGGQGVTCRAAAPGFRLEAGRGGDNVAVRVTPI